jgi:hypothetical protein
MADKKEMEPIGEMTLKAMGCNAKEAVKQDKSVFMARIFGEVAGVKVKERRSGDTYSILLGQFRGETAEKRFESERLILPGYIHDTVTAQLESAQGKAVKFGYDIFSTPDDKSTTGYKFAAKTIIKTEASDRLAEMSGEIESKPLPVPEAELKASAAKK